jgi:hypothetical protein
MTGKAIAMGPEIAANPEADVEGIYSSCNDHMTNKMKLNLFNVLREL